MGQARGFASWVFILALALGGCGGGPSSSVQSGAGGGSNLAWPPKDVSVPNPDSWETVTLFGRQAAEIGGFRQISGDALRLDGGGGLTYARYSVSGAGGPYIVSAVRIDYSLAPAGESGPPDLWLGLANYRRGAWEWAQAAALPAVLKLGQPADYLSPAGNFHLVALLWGEGSLALDKLEFTRRAQVPDSPDGLRADYIDSAGEIRWEPVDDATSYRVWRSGSPELSAAELLGSPELASWIDAGVNPGQTYYYWVSAFDGLESPPSGPVELLVPNSTLPAPTDFWSPDNDLHQLTLAWDYSGPQPFGFKLVMSETPGFVPEPPFYFETTCSPTDRQIVLGPETSMQLGKVYYCRVAAYKAGETGAWTRALPVMKCNIKFSYPKTLGAGDGMLRAARDGDSICAAWFDHGKVLAARRDALGEWQVADTGLGPLLATYPGQPLPHSGFGEYLDISAYQGQYLVCAYGLDTRDLWAARGVPGGSWTQELIDGDGDPSGGERVGINLDCASGSGGVSVAYVRQPAGGAGLPAPACAFQGTGASGWEILDLGEAAPQLDSHCWANVEFKPGVPSPYLAVTADEAGLAGAPGKDRLLFGRLLTDGARPKVDWLYDLSEGGDWNSSGVPAQLFNWEPQLSWLRQGWILCGYSPSQLLPGYLELRTELDGTAGCFPLDQPYDYLLEAGPPWGLNIRASNYADPTPFHQDYFDQFFWIGSRQEIGSLQHMRSLPFWPPYNPVPLPGLPGPYFDFVCTGYRQGVLLYLDLASSEVRCSDLDYSNQGAF